MNRREFLARAGLVATWAAIPVAISACGSDYGSSTPPPDDEQGDVTGNVGICDGHSHSVKVTAAQIEAGDAVVLTLTGSGHTHTVSLTAAEVGAIGERTGVTKESSDDRGHSHQETFH